jgi:formamidopyrimidine-DNA glycosylase
MPELPEVEVLVRYLRPLLKRRTIRGVDVLRPKTLAGTPARTFERTLTGATFTDLHRRGKYLVFQLSVGPRAVPARSTPFTAPIAAPDALLPAPRSLSSSSSFPSFPSVTPHSQLSTVLLGHLGMTGRMYLLPANAPLPRHAAVVLHLDRQKFVFEDTRYFGRLTLNASPLEKLGPEPLDGEFTPAILRARLNRSRQPIKVKLLDQSVVAGVGNIYASEALFRARISPRAQAGSLTEPRLTRLCNTIREVLQEAIAAGSTIPLNFRGRGSTDRLFYYGTAPDAPQQYEERLLVYDREKQPCPVCRTRIRRITQSSRSTYYCPQCQPR